MISILLGGLFDLLEKVTELRPYIRLIGEGQGFEGHLFRTQIFMVITLLAALFEKSLAVLIKCRRLNVSFEPILVLEAPFYVLAELFG